jgi:hypothetical protein
MSTSQVEIEIRIYDILPPTSSETKTERSRRQAPIETEGQRLEALPGSTAERRSRVRNRAGLPVTAN